jgi:uncharacterized protein YqgC (DUF456 family)
MENVWLVLSIILVLAGFIGNIVPMLPGIPLMFGGFLLWGLASGWRDFSINTVIILGIVTIVVFFLDYYAGAAGAKKYGASKAGVWGSIIGGILGVLIFNIVGLILGPLVGAVLGELFAGKARKDAWRAGWGAFVGLLAGGLIKIITAVIMLGLFFYYLIV